MNNPKLSFVIPVFDEEQSVEPLYDELKAAMKFFEKTIEIIFIDDGSSDTSPTILDQFRQESETVKVITLPQRSGQTAALRQGLDAAKGEFIITLDADLQNDPFDVPKMLKKMEKGGYDCVCGWRKAREDSLLKAGLSKLGNVLQRLFTGMTIHDISCTLRVYKKDCVDKIALNWEGQHRFIPLSLSLQGYKIGEIETNHRGRRYGYSKYSHKRIFRVMVDFFKILSTKGRK